MADIVDSATRSRMMSGIRDKNTGPEIAFRKALHARGYRYRIHVKNLPGKPDLVLPRFRAVVFVHGCFWHGHVGCPFFRIPSTRITFWTDKLGKNRGRDAEVCDSLLQAGWRVLIVWECAVRKLGAGTLADSGILWLKSPGKYNELTSAGIKPVIQATANKSKQGQ